MTNTLGSRPIASHLARSRTLGRTVTALLALLILLSLVPALAHGQSAPPASPSTPPRPTTQPTAKKAATPQIVRFDRWYQVLLSNAPVGCMQSRVVERRGERPTVNSTTSMHISIRRGEATMTIMLDTSFVETPEGKPIKATCMQALGAAATLQTLVFRDDGVELTTQSEADTQTQTLPPLEFPATQPGAGAGPGAKWLPPAAAERYVRDQMAAGAKEIRYFTVDPSAGPKIIETIMKRVGDEKVEVMGKTVPATAWDETVSIMPNIVTRCHLDAHADVVRTSLALMPGMKMEIVQSEERLARANVNPPEMMAATLIRPDHPIPNARTLQHAVYELTYRPDAPAPGNNAAAAPGPFSLPDIGAQLGQRLDAQGHTWKLIVDASATKDRLAATQPADLESSTMINAKDEKIRELLAKALGAKAPPPGAPEPPADPAATAERLRRFVHHYITAKDLSVGMATASEVARTAEGDCTEHAVLLAALLRVAGIPSRTASGLIYVDSFAGKSGGIFGYHMWAQAWIRRDGRMGQWVDFDAVLDDATSFDATHILLSVSAMSDADRMSDMVDMAALFGRLSIKVVEPAKGK
ncbi:MAG: transglutaminase-like domain-containing protein [Planctomycetota bacterium]|nr:transglutaminase-like domain-containing protein [Planctomycetota bacterium]